MASVSNTLNESVCVICRATVTSSDNDVAEVSRGLDRICEFSDKYGDTELTQYLLSAPKVVRVHNSCRRTFTSKRKFERKCGLDDTATVQSKTLRSSSEPFAWKIHCFFCSETCNKNQVVRRVETLEIRRNVLQQCEIRGDTWGLQVQSRLNSCCDLVAEEASYHKNCHKKFFYSSIYSARGRPSDASKSMTFDRVCEWLEMADSELLTLQDVICKAQSLQ